MTLSFDLIYKQACKRKEGEANLKRLLTDIPTKKDYLKQGSDRMLALMTKCIFQSGFVWKVIEKKWPDFEEVFHHFDPETLLNLPDEEWESFSQNAKIVRNHIKIDAIYQNAQCIVDTEKKKVCPSASFYTTGPVPILLGCWII